MYCDFYLELTKYGGLSAYVNALQQEIHRRLAGQDPNTPLETVYWGGGTPSLLPADVVAQVLSVLGQYYDLRTLTEVTLEVNPLDLASSIADYQAAGVNRFSVGVQSLQPQELRKLSRRHRVEQAQALVEALAAHNVARISVDLMYGIPGQTRDSWQATLQQVARWPVTHWSLYGLQLEANTPLATLVHKAPGVYPLPDDELVVTLYQDALQAADAAGLPWYEFSNFARPGHESQHNQAYWAQRSWWGFGPGAHGYVDGWLYAVHPQLQSYLKAPLLAAWHRVGLQEQLENRLIFGLRRRQGVALQDIAQQFGEGALAAVEKALAVPLAQGLLQRNQEGYLQFTPQAIAYSNHILQRCIGLQAT